MTVRASRFVAATLAVLSSPALAAELSSQDQAKLIANVDAYASRMSEVALQIWSAPELGYLETKTSALLQSELKAAGFTIETGVAGMPTAFVARAGTREGQGPLLLLLIRVGHLCQTPSSLKAEPHAGPAAWSIIASGRKPAIFSATPIMRRLRVPLPIAIFTT